MWVHLYHSGVYTCLFNFQSGVGVGGPKTLNESNRILVLDLEPLLPNFPQDNFSLLVTIIRGGRFRFLPVGLLAFFSFRPVTLHTGKFPVCLLFLLNTASMRCVDKNTLVFASSWLIGALRFPVSRAVPRTHAPAP